MISVTQQSRQLSYQNQLAPHQGAMRIYKRKKKPTPNIEKIHNSFLKNIAKKKRMTEEEHGQISGEGHDQTKWFNIHEIDPCNNQSKATSYCDPSNSTSAVPFVVDCSQEQQQKKQKDHIYDLHSFCSQPNAVVAFKDEMSELQHDKSLVTLSSSSSQLNSRKNDVSEASSRADILDPPPKCFLKPTLSSSAASSKTPKSYNTTSMSLMQSAASSAARQDDVTPRIIIASNGMPITVSGINRWKPLPYLRHQQKMIPTSDKIINSELCTSEKHQQQRWTEEEDIILRSAIKEGKPVNWQFVSASYFGHTRSPSQCQSRWRWLSEPFSIRGYWSPEEDEKIQQGVENGLRFSEIANVLPGRITEQVKERWLNNIDPSVKKGPWSNEEIELLISYQKELGNKWAKIALLLQRTRSNVKNKWYSIQRKNEI